MIMLNKKYGKARFFHYNLDKVSVCVSICVSVSCQKRNNNNQPIVLNTV